MRAAIITSIVVAGWMGPALRGSAGSRRSDGESVVPWFTMIERSFVSLADALPADRWALRPGPVEGPYGGKTTRLGIATLAVWHATDHYGQLVVYLRMNGIVPPASAGTAP